MDKNGLLRKITEKYTALGIAFGLGETADITVDQKLSDTRFSTGKAKFHYQNSVLISEGDGTVYFWEQAREMKSGFSFGISGESHSQSGAALFRKVKSVQYSPEGKAYEYEFDIGQPGRIVKSCAIENGFKLKTVPNKKKASYR